MNSTLLGALGEQFAAKYLRYNNYKIKAANFKTFKGEIDIIAQKKDVLCFIEVKTRQIGGLTNPADAVDIHKQENIKSAAAVYMNNGTHDVKNIRFDIIEVFVEGKELQSINHIENAF